MPKIPFRVSPMLATLTAAPFSRPHWIFEEKYDGYRILAYKEGSRVSLISRNAIDRTDRYPEIAAEVASLKPATLLLDGEVVVFDKKRVSRFQFIQRGEGRTEYAVFDCLYCNGKDLRREPLSQRRATLKSVLKRGKRLFVSEVLSGDGMEAFRIATRKKLEGVVAKSLDSAYESRRSSQWLKVKVHQEQEFVIGGFTPPKGSRQHFGALLLGVYNGGDLQYVGKVGAGFDDQMLASLGRQFRPLLQRESPFASGAREKGAVYLKPKLVAQLSFTEWTRDNRLRHPVFLGLRDDKQAREVHREA